LRAVLAVILADTPDNESWPSACRARARRSSSRSDAFTYQNRGSAKQALGDLDGALADINEAIRINSTLPSPLNNDIRFREPHFRF